MVFARMALAVCVESVAIVASNMRVPLALTVTLPPVPEEPDASEKIKDPARRLMLLAVTEIEPAFPDPALSVLIAVDCLSWAMAVIGAFVESSKISPVAVTTTLPPLPQPVVRTQRASDLMYAPTSIVTLCA